MAVSDEKVLQYKDLRAFNEKNKDFIKQQGGAGATTTLADLGITATAEQLNNVPSMQTDLSNVLNALYLPFENGHSLVHYQYQSLALTSGDKKTIDQTTGITTAYNKILGGVIVADQNLISSITPFVYYKQNGYFYVKFDINVGFSGLSTVNFNAEIYTIYTAIGY